MSTETSTFCSCGSNLDFSDCCGPVLEGKRRAMTAEELLRARYSAFARGEIEFILSTHHSRTRPEVKREEIEDWSRNSEWLGLRIAQIEGGRAEDRQGTIIFHAQYIENGKKQDHWEQSLFEKEGDDWRFLDAKGIQMGTYRRAEPKVGRNDPCPCGSGRKRKRCCAV